MYQAKVENTQKYENSQGSHVVTPAKLILIKGKKYHTFVKRDDGTLFKPTKVSEVENDMSWVKPILISETEEIEKGDWVYNTLNDEVYQVDNPNRAKALSENSKYYKTLALPELFSDKHQRVIVDGKMEDGDEVLVKLQECDYSKFNKYYCSGDGYLEKDHGQNQETCPKCRGSGILISLDRQNHITLFPAKQSLLEAFCKEFDLEDQHDVLRLADLNPWKTAKWAAEWAKKNNY